MVCYRLCFAYAIYLFIWIFKLGYINLYLMVIKCVWVCLFSPLFLASWDKKIGLSPYFVCSALFFGWCNIKQGDIDRFSLLVFRGVWDRRACLLSHFFVGRAKFFVSHSLFCLLRPFFSFLLVKLDRKNLKWRVHAHFIPMCLTCVYTLETLG